MFEKIIGNEKNKTILKKALELNKTSHSYLFWGTEGIGKKKIALEFAKKLLCLTPNEENCRCKACIEFDSNNNPDFMMIEPQDGKVKIDQIREMQRKVAEKPIVSDNKVYIIDDSDTMTSEAQNCLLKTLEEPPEFAIIILIGNNESLFLETIKSRCVILHFEKISNDDIKKYIEKNFEIKNLSEDILKIFQGSIGKVNSLKDKIAEYENIKNIIDNINKKDLIDIINMSKIIYESKEEINSILEYINAVLIEKAINDYRFTKCIEIVENTKERLKNNGNYDMCIDNMLFNMWREIN